MEEKEISDKKEVENISTEMPSGMEQTVSSPVLPSYSKSFSKTRIELTTCNYTWKIDQFKRYFAIVNTLYSPPFPEKGRYMIQINILRKADERLNTIQFYIRTDTAFIGSCITTVMSCSLSETVLSTKSISSRISDMTLLIEIPSYKFNYHNTLKIHCKFEIFQPISSTIHMNLPTNTEDLTPGKFQSKNEETIKFIIGNEQYVASKKLLCATNSSYFTNLCLTLNGKEKDMTNELITHDEIQNFKILLFIINGSKSIESYDYYALKKLLAASNKYDVSSLKLTCERYLLRCITIKNAVELLQLAFSSNAKFLETHSATFIKFHLTEIVNTKEFRNLPQKDSNKIMEFIEKSEIRKTKTPQFFSTSA